MVKGSSLKTVAAVALMLGAAACAQETAPDVGEAAVVEETTPTLRAAAAIATPTRPEADYENDHLRKAVGVLAYIDINPGDAVFEVEAGDGYYTELFSILAGPDGQVIMQNPESFDAFLGDAVSNRLADNRLANVRMTKSNFDALDAGDSSMDIVTWILGPHELYYMPNGDVSLGDPETAYAEIARVLKPGGVFVVLDHAAAPGAPETTGGTTHRIDPAIVKTMAAGAGFEYVSKSDLLHNPDDDYEIGVFDPSVRRKTDRFLFTFQKPE